MAILVSSCDKYKDLWPIFFELFWRYWPDCPFRIYLLTNHDRYDDPRVTSIAVGDDRQWASNSRIALAQIPYPYIFLMEEENLYRRPVNTVRVCELIAFGIAYGAACMRLYPSPPPNRQLPGRSDIGSIDRGAPYRFCFSAGVWKREVIESLLVDGETGWDMEVRGSRRADLIEEPFLSVTLDPLTGRNTNPPLPYMSKVISRGRWTREAVALCASEGILVDGTLRPIRTKLEERWEVSLVRGRILAVRSFLAKLARRAGLLPATRGY